MTPEELEKLVAMADTSVLAEALENLSEADRRKLSKTAGKLYRDIDKVRFEFNPQTLLRKKEPLERLKDFVKGRKITIQNQFIAAELAALGCCPISTVRRVDGRGGRQGADQVLKVLLDRRPAWIDEWIEEKLKDEWSGIFWTTVRALVNRGVCIKPVSDGYVNLMVEELPGTYYENKTNFVPLSKKLLDDPGLLEDEVWHLFEVENYAFGPDYKEGREGTPDSYESWPQALKKLSESDQLDRQRLLDACLSGLSTGFKNNALTSYINFFMFLEPSLDELVARQETFIDLISNKASHVVTFVLKMLRTIDKREKLDDRAFVGAVSSVWDIKTKGQPKAAIMLLKRIIKRKPELTHEILKVAVYGLTHESADIQELVISLIEGHMDAVDGELLSSIAGKVLYISATHQSRIDAIIGEQRPEEEGDRPDLLNDAKEIHQALMERACAINPAYRKYAGLDHASETLDSLSFLPAMTFSNTDIPLLTGLKKIEPIETVEELIDAVAHAVEVVDSADEVERILDGISRLCDQKPDDFEKRTEAVLKRINKDTFSETARGLVHSWGTPFAIYRLLNAWFTGKDIPQPKPDQYSSDVWVSVIARLNEITERVLRNEAMAMLSAPTHKHGWIDACVLVDRLLLLQDNGIDLPEHDFIQALLRIAPDRRDKALDAASSLRGMPGDIIAWALGGEIIPGENGEPSENKGKINSLTKKVTSLFARDNVRKEYAPFWITAGRARFPLGTLTDMKFLKMDNWGPDGTVPAEYMWEALIKKGSNQWSNKDYYYKRLEMTIKPEINVPDKIAFYPTIALHMRKEKWSAYGVNSPWLLQWIGMLWPQNTDPYFATGVKALDYRMDYNSSTFDPNFVYLEPLLDTNRPISDIGSLVLWLGLAGRDADSRGFALDILANAIEDGRAHPDILGPTLVKLGKNGWLKLNRLKETLGETARLSSLHTYVIALVLDQWLAAQDKLPRDAHFFLGLILELNINLGTSLSEKARLPLENVKGSSKTAKLSKKLLQHNPLKPGPAVDEALLQQLEQRVARAERWQGMEAQ